MAGQPTPAVPYLRGARAVNVTDEKGGQNKWSNKPAGPVLKVTKKSTLPNVRP